MSEPTWNDGKHPWALVAPNDDVTKTLDALDREAKLRLAGCLIGGFRNGFGYGPREDVTIRLAEVETECIVGGQDAVAEVLRVLRDVHNRGPKAIVRFAAKVAEYGEEAAATAPLATIGTPGRPRLDDIVPMTSPAWPGPGKKVRKR